MARSRLEVHDQLKIGMVAPVWVPSPPKGYGGVEWIVHWLCEGMIERGHEVVLVAPGDSATKATEHVVTYKTAPYRRMGEPLPELLHAAAAYDAVRDCDVVHDHTLGGPAVGRNRGLPIVHTVHGPLQPEMVEYYEVLRGVGYVAISHAQRGFAPSLPWTATVHNAVDVESFPFSAEKDDYLAFLARMTPDKGVVEAIRLARDLGMPLRIAAKLNEPFELEYFRNHVQPLLGGGIEYIGELGTADKKQLLLHARALAFPIQWDEPFGMAMVEALACGTPILAIDRGAVPEIVHDGVTGVFAPDLPALTARARAELDSLDSYRCRAEAVQRFDVARLVDEYESVYRHTVSAAQQS